MLLDVFKSVRVPLFQEIYSAEIAEFILTFCSIGSHMLSGTFEPNISGIYCYVSVQSAQVIVLLRLSITCGL